MKILVIGANGQLGTDVVQRFVEAGHDVTGINHDDEFDVQSEAKVNRVVDGNRPDAVVNTSAMHHVERCEKDPGAAFAVNGLGARNVARACNRVGSTLLHISTDYVFDGGKNEPYSEGDLPLPLNVYGITKLAGEHFVRSIADQYYVVRTSGLYGANPCRAKGGLNFVQLMLKLAKERDEVRVVTDEVLTPTCTADLAEQLLMLLESGAPWGTYHATAQGACSWFEFAAEIFRLAGCDVKLEPARPGEFPMKVPRPSYSVLRNKALQELDLDNLPTWQDCLAKFLKNN